MSIKIDQRTTLLQRITASEGSELFRSLYGERDGELVDILANGQVSCAVYVSGLLVWAGWIDRMRATVASLERGLLEADWNLSDELVPGAVVIWEGVVQASGRVHEHAGFVLSATEAVSHSDSVLAPARHHITYGETTESIPVRKIKAVYVRDELFR